MTKKFKGSAIGNYKKSPVAKKKIKKQLDLKNQGRRNQKSAPIAESKNLSENIDLLAF